MTRVRLLLEDGTVLAEGVAPRTDYEREGDAYDVRRETEYLMRHGATVDEAHAEARRALDLRRAQDAADEADGPDLGNWYRIFWSTMTL